MKRLFVLVSCAVLLGGCAMTFPKPPKTVRPVAMVTAPVQLDANGNAIERVPFRAGVSTVTVEKLAKQYGCTGGQGAGLMTAPGPVEVYRMICESKQVFMARCEFRQCKPMAAPPPGGYAVAPPKPAPAPVSIAVAAPQVAAATGPAAAAAPAGLQAPKLVINWACGACAANDKVGAAIVAAYEKEAAARGYAVSGTEIAPMTIEKFQLRAGNSGRETLSTQTRFAGKLVKVNESSNNTLFTMNNLSESVGKMTFEKLFSARK